LGAGILTYFKENLCKMTEYMQASLTQSRQAVIARYCLNKKAFVPGGAFLLMGIKRKKPPVQPVALTIY